ncbi:MAG: APC family permease, partial [Comamonadaceae bacterium]
MEIPETQIKSRSDVPPAAVSSDTPERHLDQGHLSGLQAGGLAIATFGPGVGIVTVPAFTWMVAGSGSWLSVLLAVLGTSLVGISIVLFARRSVGTGSLYSYIGESFKPWARVVTASGVVVGYVFAVAGLLAGTGTYLVSFLVSEGVVGDAGDGVYIATYVISAAIAAMFAIRGLDASVRVSVSLALISVPVAVVVLVGAIRNTGIDLTSQLSLSDSSFGGVTQGVATAAAFLVMFESSAALAAETRSPRKTIPRVVMAVPIGLGTIFALATVVQ